MAFMGVVTSPWERWWHGKTHTIAAYEIHGFCYTPMGKVMACQSSYRMVFAMMHGFCHEAWLIPCITLFHPRQAVAGEGGCWSPSLRWGGTWGRPWRWRRGRCSARLEERREPTTALTATGCSLNRDYVVEIPFIKLIQLVISKEPGSFHQDCIFLNTDAVAEIHNCLTQEMDEPPLKLQENKVKHQRLKV